jgi:RNA polymerase sigma-70 factor (ECF subfamily)
MQIDQKTVVAFQAGNPEAFRKIYEITKQPVFSVIYRMVTSQPDAEDIMHDVYVRIFEKRHLYESEKAGLYTWIYQVAVNQALNALKKRKRFSAETLVEPSMKEKEDTADDREIAVGILQRINPDFKACLILREIEEKSYEEIATILNISIGTVRSRINRGRKEIKDILKNMKEVS